VVLRHLVESVGYTWSDLFHVTDEHRRICLVNNRSISNPSGPQLLTSKYEAFLPDTKASDFLKDYCRVFGLAPFADLEGTHLTLVPLQSLVGIAPRTDWTAYAASNYSRKDSPGIARFAFPDQDSATRYPGWRELGPPDYVYEYPPVSLGNFLPVGLYYISSRAQYYRAVASPTTAQPNATYIQNYGAHGSVTNPRGKEEIVPKLNAVQDSDFYGGDLPGYITQAAWSSAISYEAVATSEEQPESISHALAIYRGLSLSKKNILYPRGGINNYDYRWHKYDNEKLSLRWLGEDGLYANHWRDWDDMLKSTTAVERTFLLPLSELIGFDFRNKVRVGNKNYFVREIEFQLSAGGVSPTQCVLVAVS